LSVSGTDLQCIHRDLKGENLLITSNERVKVTDFGFARISSRNAEEMRRMTYCGTDVSVELDYRECVDPRRAT
jgi:serine/threonine protein kinase